MKKFVSLVTALILGILTVQCNSPTYLPLEHEGQIAFISVRDENAEVYSVNIDGTGLKRLTDSPWGDSEPIWSPDGSKIAFVYGRRKDSNVFLMNANGTHQRQITSGASAFFLLRFLDEKRILFVSRDQENNNKLGVAYTDGSDFISIDQPFGSLSPDEIKIAYQEKIDILRSDLFIFDVSSSDRHQVTNNVMEECLLTSYSPVWSPSGSKVAFITSDPSDREIYTAKIYLVNADGTGLQQLTDRVDKFHPFQWSPDGSKIAFQFQSNIYTINVDGTNRTQITDSGEDGGPTWSPDGSKIAFISRRNGNWDIFVVDSDGSNLVQLTFDEKDDYEPVWRP